MPSLGEATARKLPGLTQGAGLCAGCGVALPEGSHHNRKWCSGQCRKQTLYSTPCVDCGAPTSGCNGKRPGTRCLACAGVVSANQSRERWMARRELIEQMWAAGKTSSAIAAEVGYKGKGGTFISLCRRRGYNLPHRRSPEVVAQLSKIGTAGLVLARAAKVAKRNESSI